MSSVSILVYLRTVHQLQPNDVIWAKFDKFPYWPALVREGERERELSFGLHHMIVRTYVRVSVCAGDHCGDSQEEKVEIESLRPFLWLQRQQNVSSSRSSGVIAIYVTCDILLFQDQHQVTENRSLPVKN